MDKEHAFKLLCMCCICIWCTHTHPI